MFLAAAVLSVLLALAAAASGGAKLAKQAPVMESMDSVGVPDRHVPKLAVLELLGAAGLVIGLFWAPLGIAAAIGLVLYFAGAVIAHLRVHDEGFGPAAGLAVFSFVVLVLRLLSA